MIYLDHNSTTPYSPSVCDYLKNNFINHWANTSASHNLGIELHTQLTKSRKRISEILKCSEESLIFTSGATESINTVLSISHLKHLGITTVVTSSLEHKATLDSAKFLEKNGINLIWLKNDDSGVIDLVSLEDVSKNLKNALFSLMMVNNETGTIQPIAEIAKIIHRNNNLIHIDGVQALGKLDIDLKNLNVDFASFSGHKIGALKGIGLLYAKQLHRLVPLIHGGGQEAGFRSGTLNFPGVKSIELALLDTLSWNLESITELRNYLEDELLQIDGIIINSRSASRICNTSNICLKGLNSRAILKELSASNIFISIGSACNSSCPSPSHVLKGLGLSDDLALSSIRVSLGSQTTVEEIKTFISCIKFLYSERER